jgi:hypothetical protein
MRQNFKDLANTAVVNYKDTNFCTVAALAMTLDWSYGKAHRWMSKHGNRFHRRGMYIMAWRPAIEGAAKSVGKRFFEGDYHLRGDGRAMTLSRFCKEHPTGTYYVQVNRHAVAIVDGVMHDWTADTAGRRKIITSFKLTDGE